MSTRMSSPQHIEDKSASSGVIYHYHSDAASLTGLTGSTSIGSAILSQRSLFPNISYSPSSRAFGASSSSSMFERGFTPDRISRSTRPMFKQKPSHSLPTIGGSIRQHDSTIPSPGRFYNGLKRDRPREMSYSSVSSQDSTDENDDRNSNYRYFEPVVCNNLSNNRRFAPSTSETELSSNVDSICPQEVSNDGSPTKVLRSLRKYSSNTQQFIPLKNNVSNQSDPSCRQSLQYKKWENCLFLEAEGARPGTLILTNSHLVFRYEDVSHHGPFLADLKDYVDYNDLMREEEERKDYEDESSQVSISIKMETPKKQKLTENMRWGKRSMERHDKRGYDVDDVGMEVIVDEEDDFSNETISTESVPTCTMTNEDEDEDDDEDDDHNDEDTQLQMDNTLIRAIEEEARRRLKELDDSEYDTISGIDHTETVKSVTSGLPTSNWEKEHLKRIEKRALKYLRRLDQNSEEELDSDTDDELIHASSHESNIPETELTPKHDQNVTKTHLVSPIQTQPPTLGLKWSLKSIYEVYPRRYQMKDIAFELFGPPSPLPPSPSSLPLGSLSKTSIYFAFPNTTHKGKSRHEIILSYIKKACPNLNLKYYRSARKPNPYQPGWRPPFFKKKDPINLLTKAWRKSQVSNFDYILRINSLAGRTRHDISHYPIFPWVLSNYSSDKIPNLSNPKNFRDLAKPMGALCSTRLQERFMRKYRSLCNTNETSIPPFMYGSHYSSAGGVVLHYLVRLPRFAEIHRDLQDGEFDVPDRLFHNVQHTWEMCSRTSLTEVKELTPEFYSDGRFLRNTRNLDFGWSFKGKKIGDVVLPPWADNSPEKFINVMKAALECDLCSEGLPGWLDLVFGTKQKGSEARKAFNIFYHLTYYGCEDLQKIEDADLREETELHIAGFGHCPQQMFYRPHSKKKERLLGDSYFRDESKNVSPLRGESPSKYRMKWFHEIKGDS